MMKRKYFRKHYPFYNRVLSDREVFRACKLRHIDPEDGNKIFFSDFFERAFGVTLVSWRQMISPLGHHFGRWEVYDSRIRRH